MNFFKDRKNRTLAMLFAVIGVLMVVQIVTLYVVSNSLREEAYLGSLRRDMELCVSSVDNTVENAKRMAVALSLDRYVISALSSSEVSLQEQQVLSMQLRLYQRMTQNVREMYFYNAEKRWIYPNGVSVDDFPFPQTRARLSKQATEKFDVYSDQNERSQENGGIIRIQVAADNKLENYIMVDVPQNVLETIYKEFEGELGGKVYLYNAAGELLYATTGGDAAKELRDLKEGEILPGVADETGQSCFAGHIISKQLGGSIYFTVPKAAMYSNDTQTRALVWVNICIFLMTLLVIALMILFRGSREFILESTKKASLARQDEVRRTLFAKHASLIRCMRERGAVPESAAEQDIQALAYGLKDYKLALLRLDLCAFEHIRKVTPVEELAVRKYELMEQCERVLREQLRAEAVYEQEEYTLYLLAVEDVDYLTRCQHAYWKCRELVKKRYDLEISMSVSSSGTLETLPDLLRETVSLSEYRFILDEPTFRDYSLLLDLDSELWPDIERQISVICANLITPGQDVGILLGELFAILNRTNVADAKKAVHELFLEISKCSELLKKENLGFRLDFTPYFSRMAAVQSLADAKAMFDEIVKNIGAQCEKEQDDRYGAVVGQVMGLIREHLSDPALCRTMIADEVGMSKSYLSRIFKSYTGVSISDMINDLRLKAVSEQLLSTNKSIKEIIDDVGIVNHSYFTVMFKKKYGVTPSEYRNR